MNRIRLWAPETPFQDSFVSNHIKVEIEGIYHVELVDKHTQEIKFSSMFKNVITDAGLDRVHAGSSPIEQLVRFLEAGTGNTPPSVADTTLVAPLTPRSSGSGDFPDEATFIDSGSYTYTNWVRTRIFNDTEANGVISELGLFNAPTAGVLFSRVLIKDGMGTPTSIVKTSNDILRVRYTLRLYHPTNNSMTTGSFTWRGIGYSSSIRALQITGNQWTTFFYNNFGTWQDGRISMFATASLLDVTGSTLQWAGTVSTVAQTFQYLPYSNGTFYRDFEFSLGPTTGIGSGSGFFLRFGSDDSIGVTYQHVVTPAIRKANGQTLTMRYRFSLGRRTEIA